LHFPQKILAGLFRLLDGVGDMFTENGADPRTNLEQDNCVAAWENQPHGQNLRY
jgi:hypothetical protein